VLLRVSWLSFLTNSVLTSSSLKELSHDESAHTLHSEKTRALSMIGARTQMSLNTLNYAPGIAEPKSDVNQFGDENEVTASQCQIGRRAFCSEVLLTSTVLIVGATCANAAQESLVSYPPIKIAGAEKLIVGSSLYFEYPTRQDPAVLVRSAEGEYSAFSRKCSHAGCSVEFDAGGRCFKCPCHRGMFDARIGNVMYGPPQRPLAQIVLQMRAGGEVWAVGKYIGNNTDRFAQDFQRSGHSVSRACVK